MRRNRKRKMINSSLSGEGLGSRALWSPATKVLFVVMAGLVAVPAPILSGTLHPNIVRGLWGPYRGRQSDWPAREHLVLAGQRTRKLLPVDEASKDPTFKAFRDALIDAV